MRVNRPLNAFTAAAVPFLCAAWGWAQQAAPPGFERPTLGASEQFEAAGLTPADPEFDRSPGWSAGLEGYAGFAVVSTEDGGHAQALIGAVTRVQVSYFTAGAFLEATDGGDHHWRSVGGFAGAVLPYRNWVDFELSGGVAARTYRNSDVRFGPDGYEATSPALLLRAGFSDRSGDEGLLGFRLGGLLYATFDLEHHERSWRYAFRSDQGQERFRSGVLKVGGFSAGLAVTAGFDFGVNPSKPN